MSLTDLNDVLEILPEAEEVKESEAPNRAAAARVKRIAGLAFMTLVCWLNPLQLLAEIVEEGMRDEG